MALQIGLGEILVTPNKDYVSYANTTRILTWCPGATGCRGVTVSTANSVTGLPANSGRVPKINARKAGDYLICDYQNYWTIWCPKSSPFQSGPFGNTTALVGGSTSIVDLPNNAFLVIDSVSLDTRGSVTWSEPGVLFRPRCGGRACVYYPPYFSGILGPNSIGKTRNSYPLAHEIYPGTKFRVLRCSGTSPCVGTVSATRSLVGESTYDCVRFQPFALFPEFSRRNQLLGATSSTEVTLSQEAVPAHYIVRWRSDFSGGSVTVCPTAGGCVGVVTDPAVSLVGTETQTFKYDSAPWLWFLLNGNLVVRAAGEPGGASQGNSFVLCVPGTTCKGTLSASNTFHGGSSTNVFMPPVGSAQYNASSYYAAIADAAGGLGAVRLCSGVSFDCLSEFTAANSAVGSAEHTGLGGSNFLQDDHGAWISHQDASWTYLPFVNGVLPTGPVVTKANWVPGGSTSVVLDPTGTPLGPIYANGNLGTVSIGLNQQYHNHFEALYAESADDEVILRLWVDEPVQMIGWAAGLEVVGPSSNATQTLVFNESGRARVQCCSQCTFADGAYPASRKYRAQIKLTPAVFFTVPNWDTILDFSLPAPVAEVTPTSCTFGGACSVHVSVSGPGAVAPYRVTLDGEECTLLGDSTASDLHVTLPAGKPVGSYSLRVATAGGRCAALTFEITPTTPVIGGVTPACPAHGCAITIAGTAFFRSTVQMDGVTMTCPTVTTTSITCQAPATGVAEGHTITVTNSNGLAATTAYAYNIPHPVISGVSPQVEATGGDITITGSGFLEPVVTIGGASCAVVSSTATQIVCTAPQAPAEHCNLTVISAGGYAASTPYTYRVHRPTVTGASPACGPLGCQITVQGSDFHGPTVTVDGVACPLVGSITATSLTCTAPASTREATNLTVIDAGGFAASIGYQYSFPHPAISGVSPQVETTGGDITITGSGFLEPVVTINGAACAVVSSTATQIVCTAPQAPAEHCNLTVISAGGYAAFGTYTYRVLYKFWYDKGMTSARQSGDKDSLVKLYFFFVKRLDKVNDKNNACPCFGTSCQTGRGALAGQVILV
ncbi:hypothetical protein PAPYR_1432 [Paratrimastix pyriformis]|uniref:IPT/TIG domain-containing protein n=1 Tax=Paratrimastix pyriformis TaxID=342808 RepID=A0ABQ8USZ4_9EUKA|nr:hypothetical protein PAPYR_1432 [Paratrimastix pyriformis]